ncbi:hypothetical protein VZ95_18220 [Elstera litoralis]|uniref:DUF177 domain-containing protein n=2 Tax=Elstera litoralis TaxID=552518 RepID=A0A0F3IS13_9PROT|nr:hypothetical protein VZ95_18220 [Elstera litoralis]
MEPEFSRPLSLDRIGAHQMTQTVEATPDERAALAKRFDLQELTQLSAKLAVRRVRGGKYVSVSGRVSAAAVQNCVISLEPVPAQVESDFALVLGPIDSAPERGEIDITGEDDELEPWPEEGLDLGEIAAQYFSLALDPYPRAEGAAVPEDYIATEEEESVDSATTEESDKPNPFARLAGLAKKG